MMYSLGSRFDWHRTNRNSLFPLIYWMLLWFLLFIFMTLTMASSWRFHLIEYFENIFSLFLVKLGINFTPLIIRIENWLLLIGKHRKVIITFFIFLLRKHYNWTSISIHLLKCFYNIAELRRKDKIVCMIFLTKQKEQHESF